MTSYLTEDELVLEEWKSRLYDDKEIFIERKHDKFIINIIKDELRVCYSGEDILYHNGNIKKLANFNFFEDDMIRAYNECKDVEPYKKVYSLKNGNFYTIGENKVHLHRTCDNFGKKRYDYYKNLGYEIVPID